MERLLSRQYQQGMEELGRPLYWTRKQLGSRLYDSSPTRVRRELLFYHQENPYLWPEHCGRPRAQPKRMEHTPPRRIFLGERGHDGKPHGKQYDSGWRYSHGTRQSLGPPRKLFYSLSGIHARRTEKRVSCPIPTRRWAQLYVHAPLPEPNELSSHTARGWDHRTRVENPCSTRKGPWTTIFGLRRISVRPTARTYEKLGKRIGNMMLECCHYYF